METCYILNAQKRDISRFVVSLMEDCVFLSRAYAKSGRPSQEKPVSKARSFIGASAAVW